MYKMIINTMTRNKCFLLLLGILIPIIFGCSSGSGSPYRQTIAKTSAYIQEGMSKRSIVGLSIALVHDGRIVWAEGFGFADKEKGIPAKANTVYMIGSTSKTLTTAALLNLYDRGLVSLDEPIQTYLPEFMMLNRFMNQRQGMTVRRLLNHHSGIPGDIYNSGVVEKSWDDWNRNLYMDWLFNYLKDDYPTYEPGQIGNYCNTGFILAGEIFHRKSGHAFLNDAVTSTLFRPLGMHHTSFRMITDSLATGYINGQPFPPIEFNMAATGGAYSTVEDLAQFLIMLLKEGRHPNGNRILQPGTVALMGQTETSPLDINAYTKFGLGLDTVDDPSLRYAGPAWAKNGSTGIFNAFLEFLPNKDLGVIVLSNCNTAQEFVYAAARECLKNAVLEIYGTTPSQPPMPQMASETAPGKIAGKYVRASGYDEISVNGDGSLSWIVNAHSQAPLQKTLRCDGDAFAVSDGTERLVFTTLKWGGIPHVLMVQYGSSGSDLDRLTFDGHVVRTIGEQYTPVPIPKAWLNRTNKTYLIDNISWNDTGWDEPVIRFEEKDGMLIGGKAGNNAVFDPQNDSLAFIAGLLNRGDSSVRVISEDGREKLVIGGYQGYDIVQIPSIAVGDTMNGQVAFHKTAWYQFIPDLAGKRIMFRIGGKNPPYTLRLFDSSLELFQTATTGILEWTSRQGRWYLAISPTPEATGDYTLFVTN